MGEPDTLVFWLRAFRIVLGLIFFFLAGLARYYQHSERRMGGLRSFRTNTIIGLMILGSWFIFLGIVPRDNLPEVIRRGTVSLILWYAAAAWLLVHLWISHEVIKVVEGVRKDD